MAYHDEPVWERGHPLMNERLRPEEAAQNLRKLFEHNRRGYKNSALQALRHCGINPEDTSLPPLWPSGEEACRDASARLNPQVLGLLGTMEHKAVVISPKLKTGSNRPMGPILPGEIIGWRLGVAEVLPAMDEGRSATASWTPRAPFNKIEEREKSLGARAEAFREKFGTIGGISLADDPLLYDIVARRFTEHSHPVSLDFTYKKDNPHRLMTMGTQVDEQGRLALAWRIPEDVHTFDKVEHWEPKKCTTVVERRSKDEVSGGAVIRPVWLFDKKE